VVGIDAGGTSLRIRFVDQSGLVVLDLTGQASSDLGPEGLRPLMAARENSQSNVCAVYAGIAGISRQGMKQRWNDELKSLFPDAALGLGPDYLIAFHGAIRDVGILVIAGTGSVVYGEYKDKCRVGGRGWEWGDWGSGAWITSELLRLTLSTLDGLTEPSVLSEAVCAELGTNEPIGFTDRARQLCLSKGRGFLVPLALSCAKAGNPDALKIFSTAGEWLSRQVLVAAERLGFGKMQKFPVATVGGLWECGEMILKPFCQSIEQKYPNVLVTSPLASPIDGAIRQALLLADPKNNPA
jgi:glucosamine kinase